MSSNSTPAKPLIDFPTDFPIKVVGTMEDGFAQAIAELIIPHDPEFHNGKMEMRPSSKGNYLSLTVTVKATSREQLDNIYRALTSHDLVKFVL